MLRVQRISDPQGPPTETVGVKNYQLKLRKLNGPTMTVTVVICTRFRPAFLERRLEEVQNFSPPADQILVIDNTEGDSETENAARRFGARYSIEPIPGLRPAMRRAMAQRETDMMVFLRDDITPALGWIATFVPDLSDDESEESGENEQKPLRPVIN